MPKIFANRYRVEKLLGKGAAGKVYLVSDKLEDNKQLALKLLEAPGSRHLELMRHEFSILTKLKHPNIARVYDFGLDEESGHWFYTSEYLEGRDMIEACRDLGFADKSRLFVQMLRALQYLHSHGVVHYDIKPSNIIVDKQGTARLIDFGLATTETPVSATMRGTIGYAAPEVVRGELGDPRSDLYSLGVVFYEALAGRRPFTDDSVFEVLRIQATSEPEPPRKFDKKVPPELERIVLRLLERNPADRYYNANEANRAISQAMNISLEEETVETAMAYLLSGGFIGRDAELENFRTLVDSLEDDYSAPPVQFVTGETGIGKSRLLREVGYYAQLKGVSLASCRCATSRNQPFGPFTDTIRSISETLPKKALGRFKAVKKTLEGGKSGAQNIERSALMHEASLLLMEAARQRSIIITIDDIEEADDVALEFLKHLSQVLWLKQQEGEKTSLLVLCACNTEMASAKTAVECIEQLVENELAGRLALSPLSRKDGERLLAAMMGGSELPKEVTSSVLDAAGGNPLVIEQTVRQLFESELLFYEAGKWRASAALAKMKLPTGGEEVLKYRIEMLSENEKAVVETLACVGPPAEFELISMVSEVSADACAGAIEQLLSRRLLISGAESSYAFTSGHMREVVLGTIPAGRRRKIHGRIYSYLEQNNADVVEQALHAEKAELEEDRLMPVLREAAKQVQLSFGLTDAAPVIIALLKRLSPYSEEWYEVQYLLSITYLRNAKLDKMFECAKAADHDTLWQFPQHVNKIIRIYCAASVHTGRIDEADRFFSKARRKITDEAPERLRADLLFELGNLAHYKGEVQKARELFTEARKIYVSLRLAGSINFIDHMLFDLDLDSGRFKDAEKRIRLVFRRKSAEKLGASLHRSLGSVCRQKGQLNKAMEHFSIALQEYEKRGQLLLIGVVQSNFGGMFTSSGEYDKALDAFTSAKRLFQIANDERNYAVTLMNIGVVHLALGRAKEALSLYETVLKLSQKTSTIYVIMLTHSLRGKAHAVLGNTQTALADINKALRLARETDARSFEASLYCSRADAFAFLCGDFDAAESDLSKARSIAESENPVELGEALVLSARLSILRSKTGEALEYIKQAQKLKVQGQIKVNIDLVRAETLAATGKTSAAEEILTKLEDEPKSIEDRVRIGILRAGCGLKTGGEQHALQSAADALKNARQSENVVLTFEAAVAAAICAVATGDRELAFQHIGTAEETFEKVAASLPEEYDRQSLLTSPFYSMQDAVKEHLGEQEPEPSMPARDLQDSRLKRAILKDAGLDEGVLGREGLAFLGMVTRLGAAELDVGKILNLAIGMVLDLTQAERGFIILVDDDGNLKHVAARNIEDKEITSPEYQTSYTMVREVIRSGKPQLVTNIASDESLRDAKSVIELGLHSVLCMPITHTERMMGVVYLDSRSPAQTFVKDDLRLIEAFAERIAPIITRAVEQEQLQTKLRSLEEEVRTRYGYTNIVGRSKPMREMFRILDSITDTDLTVYVYGETGTGKELVAKALHYNSSRKEGPFISINCGAITETLLESELFGHVKGAFTGAESDKAGLVESANGGTLFLDEIGSMPLEMQVKLLRVIEEREVRRIGASVPVPVNIRLVCSTNIPLEELMEKGLFREDLYYRLNVARIDLPPLRERLEDIPLLAEHFVELFADEMKAPAKKVSPEAMKILVAEDWPGNVRELENRLRQAVALALEELIDPEHVKATTAKMETQATITALLPDETLQEGRIRVEKDLIISALKDADYNYSKAAKRLGIVRTWLHKRCSQLGIERE